MPVVEHRTDLFETTQTRRFLADCQQQAIRAKHDKIASLTFLLPPVAPWVVLATLGNIRQRHFYYDPPQPKAVVGLGVTIGYSASGRERFGKAQTFIQSWQDRFLYAVPVVSPALLPLDFLPDIDRGRFFCSATFFENAPTAVTNPSRDATAFEPIHVFVPDAQVTTRSQLSAVTFNCLMTATANIDDITESIYWRLQQLRSAAPVRRISAAYRGRRSIAKDVANFEGAVTAALQQIYAKKLHKVVLADVMDVVMPQPVDVVRSLKTLRQNHPDCTVFSVGNGKGQSFIGASPERLLSIANGELMTDALAGSASRSRNRGIDRQLAQSLLHSKKERYEHRVVVEFILERLRSLGLNPRHAPAPQLLQLLHIQHLHTPIRAALSQHLQPLDILASLHPTPAVAGLPLQAACQFIHQQERFDRGLYTAPLGWIDTDGNSEFIVGIRSALIDGCKARLYAGAGVVAGSEPAKELAEIKLKLQTLLNALV
ncbi:MAG: isochorismate synthase [Phormidesmis sp.]